MDSYEVIWSVLDCGDRRLERADRDGMMLSWFDGMLSEKASRRQGWARVSG